MVRFGYLHFPVLGQRSQWASEASECAAEQGSFWEYHDYLFEQQAGVSNKDDLKGLAEDLGLDTATFDDCLDSGKYARIVQDEINLAHQIGVESTPTFLVNGQPVVGAQPFETFQQVIEDQLGDQ